MDYSLNSADLSELTYKVGIVRSIQNGNTYGFERMQVFQDFDDLVILAQEKGVCYAAFRGTIGINAFDLFQLFDAGERTVGDCKVRAGFYSAYFAQYYDEFRQAIDECMQTGTELVVTGQSQGGSNAIVALIDLQEYDPIAISFGALRTLVEPCHSIDTSRHYRFVNVGHGSYDEWTNRFAKSALHMGHSLLLDATASAPAAYLGLNDNKNRAPRARDVHKKAMYWDGLISMMEAACDPIHISGWEDGHWCNSDEECDSESCVEQVCIGALTNGEACQKDNDCASKSCRYHWSQLSSTCD